MRITLKTLWASPAGAVHPGQTVEVPARQAEALIAGRYAVRAEDDPATRPDAAKPARKRTAAKPATKPAAEPEGTDGAGDR